EEAEPLRDEPARLGREHLAFGRAEEDGERRGPGAEQRDDLRPLLAHRARFRLGDLREIDRAPRARRDAIELLAHVRADPETERIEIVLLLDAVVEDRDLRDVVFDGERYERVPVQRSEQEIADADVELDGLDVALALGRRRLLLFFDEERA